MLRHAEISFSIKEGILEMRDVSLEDETIVCLPPFLKHLNRRRNDRICQTNSSKTKKRKK